MDSREARSRRILVADDDPVSLRLLEAMLEKWGYEVVACTEGQTALETLQAEGAPRLAVLDWMMPALDGPEVCRRIRQSDELAITYIIIVTARTEEKAIVEALEAGADDYLGKPVDASELRVRLRAGQRIVELQEALRHQASHDALTGIWNHKWIVDILDREMIRLQREGTALGVLMADLDHFKRINDTHGHLVGDEVLVEATARMVDAVRPYDPLGRYGGEEFLIILPMAHADRDALRTVAERIRTNVCSKAIQTEAGELKVTISIGGTLIGEGEPVDLNTVIRKADNCLYRAKEEGRNRVELSWGPGLKS